MRVSQDANVLESVENIANVFRGAVSQDPANAAQAE